MESPDPLTVAVEPLQPEMAASGLTDAGQAALRRFPGTDISVHPFAIDGSVFGWASGIDESARLLDCLADHGCNLVSTADHYAGGRSEIMIGAWLATLADRNSAIIATKIGRHPDAAGHSTRTVVSAVEACLRRLGTDYIDFLSLDGQDSQTPIEDTLEAIDMLRRAGKVRYLSVSRFPATAIRDINELAVAAVYPPIRAILSEYNLMHRGAHEAETTSVAAEMEIGIIARMPLASGYLSGSFRSKDDQPSSPVFADALTYVGRAGSRVLASLQVIADERHESLGRVATAWLLSKPGVVAAAFRVRSAEQFAELTDGGELHLTRHEVASLDKASE